MELNERLAVLRKESGLSQAEAAERLDVSRQAVSRWECGTSAPSSDNLMCLARLYGVSLDELIWGEEKEETEQEAKKDKAPAPPEEKAVQEKPLKINYWKVLAICLLALCVLLAALVYAAEKKASNETRVALSEMEGEAVGQVPKGGFVIEDW